MAKNLSREGDGGADAEAEEQFAGALAAAEASPEDEGHWDLLEELAGELQRPDEVGAVYRKVLAGDLGGALAASIGQRAAQFHEEWFSEDSPQLAEVLTRVLEIDPTAEWALQRVTVVMTVGERWTELLSLYDRALSATSDKGRREQLLDEAASLAKDFAGAPDRAIDYLSQLLALRPSDAQLVSSLEQALERQGRWGELIALWRTRLEGLSARDALAVRERIAACYLDNLADAGACLAEVRKGALDILRERYEAGGQSADVIRVVGVALGFAAATSAAA